MNEQRDLTLEEMLERNLNFAFGEGRAWVTRLAAQKNMTLEAFVVRTSILDVIEYYRNNVTPPWGSHRFSPSDN